MERRISQRNTSRMINFENAKKISRKKKTLSADFTIDTTSIDANRVANIIIDYIKEN